MLGAAGVVATVILVLTPVTELGGLTLPLLGMGLVLAAMAVLLRNMHSLPGSTLAATRATRRHSEIRDRFHDGDLDVVQELEALASVAIADPKCHAELLLTLAQVHEAADRHGDALALLEVVRNSGWMDGDRAFDEILSRIKQAHLEGPPLG